MTATISAQDAILAVHDAATLGGNDGLTLATLQAMTGLVDNHLQLVVDLCLKRGTLWLIDGRLVASRMCRTCGYGERDRHYPAYHPSAAACETSPADYCAGFPLPHHA